VIISHSLLLRMRNVSDRICRGNYNTHFQSAFLSYEEKSVNVFVKPVTGVAVNFVFHTSISAILTLQKYELSR